MVEDARPALVSRLGFAELACVMYYLQHRRGAVRWPYREWILQVMRTNAGFFPASHKALDGFAEAYLSAATLADAMGVWFYSGEDRVLGEYCPNAELLSPASIEPYYDVNPWSRALRGRRVLVVHPFAESIREQYESNREKLFDNPDLLPPFDLTVLKAVQSVAGEVTEYGTWFDALDSMREAMDAIAYDVCIVGAGGYGLPLAAHAKKSGKVGIHMGGATQVLFGIKGRRWDEMDAVSKLYKDSWVRPKASEVPRDWLAVEDGCYW